MGDGIDGGDAGDGGSSACSVARMAAHRRCDCGDIGTHLRARLPVLAVLAALPGLAVLGLVCPCPCAALATGGAEVEGEWEPERDSCVPSSCWTIAIGSMASLCSPVSAQSAVLLLEAIAAVSVRGHRGAQVSEVSEVSDMGGQELEREAVSASVSPASASMKCCSQGVYAGGSAIGAMPGVWHRDVVLWRSSLYVCLSRAERAIEGCSMDMAPPFTGERSSRGTETGIPCSGMVGRVQALALPRSGMVI